MASLSDGANGRRIYFKSANGSRQIIYCGRMAKKQAEGVERCISDLERCRIDGSIPQAATSHWLAGISAELHAKLATHGLTQPRAVAVVEAPPVVVTLSVLIERYKARPKWAGWKEGTRVIHNYSFRRLLDFFGADRDITTIDQVECEDMVDTLRTKLAEATTAATASTASMLFRFAVRSKLIPLNPMEGVARGSYESPHKAYVDRETSLRVMEAIPDLETKLVFALARFAGLRTPSEQGVMLWRNVDWAGRRFSVDSPKTGLRTVPIRPEVMPLLERQFEAAPEGTELVFPGMTKIDRSAYAHRISRLMNRLGVDKWRRLLHSLRASMQTDWNEEFPAHVTAKWMGNSPAIADIHYNRTLEAHFDKATHIPTQHPPAPSKMKRQPK